MNFKKLRKYRRIFYLLAIIIAVVIFSTIHKKYTNTICSDIKVVVLDSNQAKFITKNNIIEYLTLKYKKDIIGNSFKNIKLSDIESTVSINSFVENAEVFRNSNDIVEIHINQKHPLLRIFDKENNSYYLDKDGRIMPTSKNFAPYVPIFSGNIPVIDSITRNKISNIQDTLLKDKIYFNCFLLAKKLKENSFTDELIDQVYVNEENEFELIPKIGDFKIILGTFENIETKLRNLEAFYKEAAPKVGWKKYSKINLEYTNQIVCTKK